RLRHLNALPDDLREVAVEGPARAAGVDGGEVEADPADDVVLGVRAVPRDRVVHREQEIGADPGLQRVLDPRRVPFGAGVREVTAEAEVGVEAGLDPARKRRRARRPVRREVEVDQVEGAGYAGLAEIE